MWRLLPDELPAELEGHDTYFQYGVKVLSLACKGPLVVRSVFKVHEGMNLSYAGTNCSNAGLEDLGGGGNRSVVTRCELQLPETGGNETERALHAKEGRCWQCGLCSNGKGCPNRSGVWCSDSFTTVASGCDFAPKDDSSHNEYAAHKVGFFINPHTKVLLAKFKACNNPGCCNATYEQEKQRTAKTCELGTCAE